MHGVGCGLWGLFKLALFWFVWCGFLNGIQVDFICFCFLCVRVEFEPIEKGNNIIFLYNGTALSASVCFFLDVFYVALMCGTNLFFFTCFYFISLCETIINKK